jgi:hypothetical protein
MGTDLRIMTWDWPSCLEVPYIQTLQILILQEAFKDHVNCTIQLLTACSILLLEKLIVSQQVSKFVEL